MPDRDLHKYLSLDEERLSLDPEIPDKDLHRFLSRDPECQPWSEKWIIRLTQWFRYWMGGVRASLKALLQCATPLEGEVQVNAASGNGGVGFGGRARRFGRKRFRNGD